MGSGKTTVGKCMAKRLNTPFVDFDFFIENRYRKSINQLFAERGESGFRKIERKILEEVAGFENVIISTGGGVPCFNDNMELMNRKGITVYLKVSVNELVSRLEACKQTRPLLKDKNKEELFRFVSETLQQRECFYNRAKIIFDTEKLTTHTDVESITEKLISYLSESYCIGEGNLNDML
jgi:Shikimate kinase